MTNPDESAQVSHIYDVTRCCLRDLVEANAHSGETDSAFVALAISLHGSNPDNLSQVLAAAVLRIATAERNRADQCDEIARLTAELDIERARAAHTKTRLRRRIHRANRGRAALRALTRSEIPA
ncbi:hypothetical protein [Nocardia sp. No.11]|uniref:hypothetical protein n=1 Tax=Nocardia sp. No.11 TaxID=3128861 RepID=UPI00319E6969